MKFYTKTKTTKQSNDSWSALSDAASAAGLNGPEVVTITQSYGRTPKQVLPQVASISAAKQASPGASLADVMAQRLNATGPAGPTGPPITGADTTRAKKKATATKESAGSQGLFSDIMGDIFETLYPWLMIIMGFLFFLVAVVVLLSGIAKTPLGSVAVGAATAIK